MSLMGYMKHMMRTRVMMESISESMNSSMTHSGRNALTNKHAWNASLAQNWP